MVRYVQIFSGEPPSNDDASVPGTVAGNDNPVTAYTVEDGHRGILRTISLSNYSGSNKKFSLRIVREGADPNDTLYVMKDYSLASGGLPTIINPNFALEEGDRVQWLGEPDLFAHASGIDIDQ